MIYWLTGQPGSGKITLAKEFIKYLKYKGFHEKEIVHIDGDGLRDMTLNYDYSKEGRDKNIGNAQTISSFMSKSGYTVVVSLVSPYRETREEFKRNMGDDIKEFYIHASDKRPRAEYKVDNYEEPLENFVDINTTEDSISESLDKIIDERI